MIFSCIEIGISEHAYVVKYLTGVGGVGGAG